MPIADPIAIKRRWRLPLLFFQAYLALTVWLFFYGPWPWEVADGGRLFAFLAASQAAIAIGYLLSWSRVAALPPSLDKEENVRSGVRILQASLLVSLALALPTSLSRAGSLVPDVVGGLANTGLAYNENFERLEAGNPYVVVEYLRMLASPWLTAVFPLAVLYWTRLGSGWRATSVLVIGLNVAVYVATGTNKGIADLIVTAPWFIYLAVAAGLLPLRRIGFKAGLLLTAAFAGFLVFFVAGQQQRAGSGLEYGTFFTGVSVIQADAGNWLSVLLPPELRVIFEALSRYVVHGYYALSMSLETDTPSTWGLGHSMFLARNADAIAGGSYFVNQSIPGVLEREDGWPMFLLWHSIYPWIASDVGFPGTIVAMGALGYLLGLSWGRVLTTASAPWAALLYLLLILFFYIPANNQIFQSGETAVAFLALLVWALRARHPIRKA